MWTPDPSIIITAEEKAAEALAGKTASVDAEADRRTAAGFTFNGTLFQSRSGDLLKITGASTAASLAVANGALPGNLRWQDPENDFAWIASDNGAVTMDAPTVIAFGMAAMAHVSDHVWAARGIKDRLLAGEEIDPADDGLWPAHK